MKSGLMLALFSLLLLSSCGAPLPDSAKIKTDMENGPQFFYFYNWGSGGERTSFHTGDIQKIEVLKDKTVSDTKGGTADFSVRIEAKGAFGRIRGEMVVHYRRFDQGWKIDSMRSADEKQGASFDMRQ